MIIATYKENGNTITKQFSCWDLYYEATFNPNIEILEVTVTEE